MNVYFYREPTFLENYEEIADKLNLSIREFDLLSCCDGKASEDNVIYWIEKRVPSANPIKFLIVVMYCHIVGKMTLSPKDEDILKRIYLDYTDEDFDKQGLSLRQLIEDCIAKEK